MAWHLVQDRRVVMGDGGARTTYEPGVYPMLWITGDVVKMYTRFWLPSENRKYPRATKFSRCATASLDAPVPGFTTTLT